MTGKQALRARMRAMRSGLSPEAQRQAGRAVFERILSFAPYQEAESVMAYIACRGELSLEPVIEHALQSGKTLLLPRCEAPGVMTARRVCRLSQLVPGSYGLMEPDKTCDIVPPDGIDLILVPGTAFDRKGHRLGQGGGYYDGFLQETGAVCAGICHDAALTDSVPQEAHDMLMDAVITPGTLILCGRRE